MSGIAPHRRGQATCLAFAGEVERDHEDPGPLHDRYSECPREIRLELRLSTARLVTRHRSDRAAGHCLEGVGPSLRPPSQARSQRKDVDRGRHRDSP